jgi:GNAT superfamily N-acetyltransferase
VLLGAITARRSGPAREIDVVGIRHRLEPDGVDLAGVDNFAPSRRDHMSDLLGCDGHEARRRVTAAEQACAPLKNSGLLRYGRTSSGLSYAEVVLDLRPTPFDHHDAARLIAELQRYYRERYGGEDGTPINPREFDGPAGYFVLGYAGGEPVACGGWRLRRAGEAPALRDGDAEIKRMYVAASHRGRGYARAVLADLERAAAAAGIRRIVLETGTRQPEAMALYPSAGYEPMTAFGTYRDSPTSRYFAKPLPVPSGSGKPRS